MKLRYSISGQHWRPRLVFVSVEVRALYICAYVGEWVGIMWSWHGRLRHVEAMLDEALFTVAAAAILGALFVAG